MGLREINRVATLESILKVASALFAEHGFHAVTTQSISKQVNIASGTLFRYAATKSELLLMVFNKKFEHIFQCGYTDALGQDTALKAVLAMVQPAFELSTQELENTLVYQRELLFGADGKYRDEGLKMIDTFENTISSTLLTFAQEQDQTLSQENADSAARSIFATFQLALTRIGRTNNPDECQRELIRQIEQIIAGATKINALSEGECESR
ncbi:TetR/AcrR family transcriptional regulator [Rothia terrae]|uniref:TetR/AcrR family transcriptional regulator n=1 Tax=Rothia terrae TaxID=396015 RepID=A0A7H2BC21_9MICC|nr:TetR/AcrR family transcriptional regulator [Rothia terrae]MDT0190035.1 helix-turn-helix domain-containing protein [Rothia terrae]QNV37217.1 TetR/AcrR family transcriptional regulator [Rothia terrae]